MHWKRFPRRSLTCENRPALDCCKRLPCRFRNRYLHAVKRDPAAATIARVAAAAGVSRATVSRVMNGSPTVAAELASRVRAAAAELRYEPSLVARSLALGRTNTVSLVVPDLANPMFSDVLKGLSHAAATAGVRVLVAETDENA